MDFHFHDSIFDGSDIIFNFKFSLNFHLFNFQIFETMTHCKLIEN